MLALNSSAFAKVAHKSLVYVDRGIVVLNKPPGVISQVQGTTRSKDGNFLEVLQNLQSNLELDQLPLSVHRLDKSTTGTLVLARTPQMARDLAQQFQHRKIVKTYLALVIGEKRSFDKLSGIIDAKILYRNGRPVKGFTGSGIPSMTSWEVVAASHSR
ncbi:hypothetical protein HGRIS_007034 [Hohenbuehelia grisea]|uniref:Pseudouridine synthase RsuA/RluA-like domain-containing protein n=1 Tax=Hohenbuehelia grisea TaxID=104357 RepID=A0ABR3JAY6_9AGAR